MNLHYRYGQVGCNGKSVCPGRQGLVILLVNRAARSRTAYTKGKSGSANPINLKRI